MKNRKIIYTIFVFLLAYPIHTEAMTPEKIRSMSLEELMAIPVYSLSKKEQQIMETPAAVYIINSDEIRRSGMAHIAELLRMVPGLQVGQRNSNTWAVTSRGFMTDSPNKILVLIDGRSLYAPLYAGVFWDQIDLIMEDIDRIEVIRGPGGANWGANAVNGIINIITKSAENTKGGLITMRTGHNENFIGEARYGGSVGKYSYRIYGKYDNIDGFTDPKSGAGKPDDWKTGRGGFRVDMSPVESCSLSVQGEVYSGKAGLAQRNENTDLSGGHIMASWQQAFSQDNHYQLNLFFQRFDRDLSTSPRYLDVYDADFSHHFSFMKYNKFSWGLGYRFYSDSTGGTTLTFDPADKDSDLLTSFIQDTITIFDTFSLTIGSKFINDDYTGFEYQPSIRGLWRATPSQSVWGAVSRTIRTPSRFEREGLLGRIVQGTSDFESEIGITYELGHRFYSENFFLDSTLFLTDYDKLRSRETSADPAFRYQYENKMYGLVYGFETAAKWQVLSNWRLIGSLSLLGMDLKVKHDSQDTSTGEMEKEFPRVQFNLRSQYDITENILFDIACYYVDDIPAMDLDSYTRLDVRLAWQFLPWMEAAAGGQNLLDNEHVDIYPDSTQTSAIERNFYIQLNCRF